MVAMSALSATLGLVVVFFVAFPLLVHGLVAFIVVQVLGERAENQEYAGGQQQTSQG
jgi:hypothetical protein